jgi:Ala-tRNA(Pro) deacylase
VVVERDSNVLERLRAALEQSGVDYVHTQHEPVYTSAEAAAVRGVPLHSGAKALILKAGDSFMMAVIPADMPLDSGALRKSLSCKRMRFATKDEVLEMTGLTPGSIPPFGSLFGLPTICDDRLSQNERINFNAGSHTDSFQVSYEAYVTYESPQLARIAKSPEG